MIIERDTLINVIARAILRHDLTELANFDVVAVHRETGKVQNASVLAPSQVDADDFVADEQPDWIVIRDNKDLLDL
jgi:hypothetical protein